jgi:hypothetical protein
MTATQARVGRGKGKPAPDPTPQVVDGMSDHEYHAHPALSSSGARLLLPPSCPARFRWERDNPPPPKKEYDLGHGAHKLVLGTGPELVVVEGSGPGDDWRSKEAKEAVAEARARGAVPLKPAQMQQITDMAEALRRDPLASALIDLDRGVAEQSLFWRDERFGIDRRARPDWRGTLRSGRPALVDYKSTRSAEPTKFARSAYDYGYGCQADWYLAAMEAVGIADDAVFLLVAQEKEEPYLVTVHQFDGPSLRYGRARNDQACETFAECQATDTWPGYSADVELISLPPWAERDYL